MVLNASVSPTDAANALNDLPIKTVNGVPIYIHDVANVRDGFIVQTNIVHSDGQSRAAAVGAEERRWRFHA